MKIMFKDITLTLVCPLCGKEHSVATTSESYDAWDNGKLIQDAMPFLSATEREQLISHLCPDCQEDIFWEQEEFFEDDFPDGEWNECGFDPYMGCYTDEC